MQWNLLIWFLQGFVKAAICGVSTDKATGVAGSIKTVNPSNWKGIQFQGCSPQNWPCSWLKKVGSGLSGLFISETSKNN